MTKILYLAHDVSDPAVGRRIAMLDAGGAVTALAGFRRGSRQANWDALAGEPVVFGQTHDGAFPQRAASVAKALFSAQLKALAGFSPDVILARNLEMLALARRLAPSIRPAPRIVYEVLDIHRLLLGRGVAAAALRGLERRLASRLDLVVTSSPAFRDHYLASVQGFGPIELVENKVLDLDETTSATPPRRAADGGSPIRIGWFGNLRCSRSLTILTGLAEEGGGAFDITLRGRPAYREFGDFDSRTGTIPHLRFAGSYEQEDLPELYGSVDYVWAIDFFEAGLNSAWLLPNRIYEGSAHGAVPIALAGTQTARFVEQNGIGIVCEDMSPAVLGRRLREADIETFRRRLRTIDPKTFRTSRAECRDLVASLAGSGPTRMEQAA